MNMISKGLKLARHISRSNFVVLNRLNVLNRFYSVEDPPKPFPEEMEEQVRNFTIGCLNNNRSLLSRSVTLLESSHPRHVIQAELLLDYVLSVRKQENLKMHPTEFTPGSFRLGIAGPPGAGKSTFCEALGTLLTGKGHKVAVLAIDPSSTMSGGSILGDKTRMLKLSYDENAFVRPSPSNCSLGGVAEHTSDLVLLCEAAGYDIVIVETVGLGQSEVMIDDLVDMVMLLMPPAMGDELQGQKKGIMEHADVVVINKADGALAKLAALSEAENRRAVQLQRPKYPFWTCQVTRCSALEHLRIENVWDICEKFNTEALMHGTLETKRKNQNNSSMWTQLVTQIASECKRNPSVLRSAKEMEEMMNRGVMTHRKAGRELINTFIRDQYERMKK